MLIRDGLEEAGGKEVVATERTTNVTASSEEVGFLVVSNPEFLREGSAI